MEQRFDKVLSEASERVEQWPEWRKSETLKLSERTLEKAENSSSVDKDKKQSAHG
jgi:hypothetical protein